jgi:hypothetical protein
MGQGQGRRVFIHVAFICSVLGFTAHRANAQAFNVAPVFTAAQQSEPTNPAESRTVGWGVKSGVQWPSFDDMSNGFDNIGGMAGVFIDYSHRGPVGVIGEVLFVNNPTSDEPGTPVGSMHFLEVPVMVRLRQKLSESNHVAVYGVAGPAFNFKLSGDDAFESQTVDLMLGGGLEVNGIYIEARIKRGSRDRVLGGVTSSYTQQTFAILVAFRVRP